MFLWFLLVFVFDKAKLLQKQAPGKHCMHELRRLPDELRIPVTAGPEGG